MVMSAACFYGVEEIVKTTKASSTAFSARISLSDKPGDSITPFRQASSAIAIAGSPQTMDCFRFSDGPALTLNQSLGSLRAALAKSDYDDLDKALVPRAGGADVINLDFCLSPLT